MKTNITPAQRRIFSLLSALEARKIPTDGRARYENGKRIPWAAAFMNARARASKETSGEWPWSLTVHARTAATLEQRGLLAVKYEPRYGSDNHGHWGGSDKYYSLTDAGRAAACELCGGTGRVATEPGSYDQGRVDCPDCASVRS